MKTSLIFYSFSFSNKNDSFASNKSIITPKHVLLLMNVRIWMVFFPQVERGYCLYIHTFNTIVLLLLFSDCLCLAYLCKLKEYSRHRSLLQIAATTLPQDAF